MVNKDKDIDIDIRYYYCTRNVNTFDHSKQQITQLPVMYLVDVCIIQA
jgi:hypothetical protein